MVRLPAKDLLAKLLRLGQTAGLMAPNRLLENLLDRGLGHALVHSTERHRHWYWRLEERLPLELTCLHDQLDFDRTDDPATGPRI